MSSVSTFFRRCPQCGRRFELRITRKELEGDEENVSNVPRADLSAMGNITSKPPTRMTRTLMEEGVPILVYDQEFRYSYKCKHCGHEWSEVTPTEVTSREEGPEAYKGD
jgi:hypothetical protein